MVCIICSGLVLLVEGETDFDPVGRSTWPCKHGILLQTGCGPGDVPCTSRIGPQRWPWPADVQGVAQGASPLYWVRVRVCLPRLGVGALSQN